MKRILTDNITENIRRQPFTKTSLDHLQQSYQEVLSSIMKGLVDESGAVVVLHGLVDSNGSATAWDISAGAVYYNGEVYQVAAFSGSDSSNVPVLTIATSYAAGDPVTFTDNNPYNVHEIKTMNIAIAPGGSGLVNYADLVPLKELIRPRSLRDDGNVVLRTKVVDIGDWNMVSTAGVSVAHGLEDHTKIRSVSVIVRNDANTNLYDFLASPGADMPSTAINYSKRSGGISEIDSTNIYLVRKTDDGSSSTFFNTTHFDSTSYNRGWVTIVYAE